jgi:hypothetical protein
VSDYSNIGSEDLCPIRDKGLRDLNTEISLVNLARDTKRSEQ